jgi:two-component sensor histidine kinase
VNFRSPLRQVEFARRVVHAAAAPLLLLDAELRVVAASQGYRDAFVEAADPEGRRIDEIAGGAWTEAGVQGLIEDIRRGDRASMVDAVVACPQGERRVRVGVAPTDARAGARTALVVAIEDLTEITARDATREAQLQEAEALLHEAQHRTANNLSMISSILSLKARGAASEEARSELEGARRRVMAIATIERHLQLDDPHTPTAVRPYLQALCRQLGDSLVADAPLVEIAVHAQPGAQPRRVAVILGLVITELVINALKYAFPRGRHGRILVEYWETATGWCAAVSDDGRGLGRHPEPDGGGLGTGIVTALAQQLRAEARVISSPAGLRVELCSGRHED